MGKNYQIIIIVIISLFLNACGKEDIIKENNHVKFVVVSNSPEVPFTVVGAKSDVLIVKEKYELELMTDNKFIGITVRCEDNSVLLKGEIYLNKKLYKAEQANSYLNLICNTNNQ